MLSSSESSATLTDTVLPMALDCGGEPGEDPPSTPLGKIPLPFFFFLRVSRLGSLFSTFEVEARTGRDFGSLSFSLSLSFFSLATSAVPLRFVLSLDPDPSSVSTTASSVNERLARLLLSLILRYTI